MSKIVRYGVLIAVMAIAIFGAGTALAFDDGDEAPFALGTEISDASGQGGIVLANINGKSYVWDEATGKCWAYQKASYQRRRLHIHNDSPYRECNGHLRPLQA